MCSLKTARDKTSGLQMARSNSYPACRVTVCYVNFDFAEDVEISPTLLRGFLGNLFIDDAEFHHHSDKAYHYPLVQYKKVDESLIVIGLQNYASIVAQKIVSVDFVSTHQGTYHVRSKRVKMQSDAITRGVLYYEFVRPWIALNEVNYSLFRTLDKNKKRRFLEKILVANVLSCLKGLGVFVDFRIKAKIFRYKALRVKVHDNFFVGFFARFCLNITLPDLIGLGKSVSKGYGVIRRVDI